MSAALVRGHWIVRAGELVEMLRKDGSIRFGPLERLEELAEHLPALEPHEWYPRHLHLQMLNAIAAASSDDASRRNHLARCGQVVSAPDSDPFLLAALKIMTPSLLVHSIPKLWSLEHRGDEYFVVEEADAQGQWTVSLAAGDGYDHVAPLALGWMKGLVMATGRSEVDVSLDGPMSGPPRYAFTASSSVEENDEQREIRELVVAALLTLADAHRSDYATAPTLVLRGPTALKILFAWMNELLISLSTEHEQGTAFRRALEEKLATVERQRAAIRQLSTPIIEIWNGVLCLPMVGVIDTARSVEVTDTLLRTVIEKDARHVIVDITGIEVMDTRTVDHFIQMAKAVRLLGARYALAGVSAQIAQTVVRMGLDLGELTTYRNLREALQVGLRRT